MILGDVGNIESSICSQHPDAQKAGDCLAELDSLEMVIQMLSKSVEEISAAIQPVCHSCPVDPTTAGLQADKGEPSTEIGNRIRTLTVGVEAAVGRLQVAIQSVSI